MGVMTVANWKSDLQLSMGGRTLDDTRMTRWINQAIQEFAYAFKFPELQGTGTVNTSEGVTNYAMAADFRALADTGFRITSPEERFGGRIMPETRVNYLDRVLYPSSTNYGGTIYYHMYNKKVYFRPIPDSTAMVLTYDYWKKVTALSGANDVSIFDDDWDDVIFRGALYRAHMAYGEHDRMVNIFNMYLSLIRSRVMAEDLEEFPEGGISYIQGQFDAVRR